MIFDTALKEIYFSSFLESTTGNKPEKGAKTMDNSKNYSTLCIISFFIISALISLPSCYLAPPLPFELFGEKVRAADSGAQKDLSPLEKPTDIIINDSITPEPRMETGNNKEKEQPEKIITCVPKVEECNGKDDDCNGQIDDRLSRPCSTSCGTGIEKCVNGIWEGCDAPKPHAEICNGKDDDCNLKIDDGAPCPAGQQCLGGSCQIPPACAPEGTKRDCKTSCGNGTEICKNGIWENCNAPIPQPEICDGKDDDCNGQIDDGLIRPCKTICGTGTEICQNGYWTNCTAALPQSEICDNKDNDCDGKIDGMTRPCSTPCGNGIETCNYGQWAGCTAPKPTAEICDGKDNDCDGQIDNAACPLGQICINNQCKIPPACAPEGTKRACKTTCGNGTEICKNGIWENCNAPIPQPEICDGKDNNCNGKIDDGLSRSCQTSCGIGTEICQNGQWESCDAPKPQTEICNGKDDDCDGKVDGMTRPCSTPCGNGIETCNYGQWAGCTAPKPTTEICDGKDNDCNGKIDDNVSCPSGQQCLEGICKIPPICQPEGSTRSCYTGDSETLGHGVCKAGIETCRSGNWGICVGEITPTQEVCDGKDNNCNGQIDEELSRHCSTTCGSGIETCQNGTWSTCSSPSPTAEICDGKDNDCNGQIDDGIKSVDCYEGAPNTNGIGPCKKGQKICLYGRWTFCLNQSIPELEICDGIDNNCNGIVDDIPPQECSYTGPSGTKNIGVCRTGTTSCVNGSWTKCSGEILPSEEICDGKDNNCDGQIDNNLTPPLCSKQNGICAGSKKKCGGIQGWIDCSNTDYKNHNSAYETAETLCDGKDNDCDGKVDNNLPKSGQKCYQSGAKGVCADPGAYYCQNGQWQCSNPQPIAEVCDDKDNNCDGHLDNNANCLFRFEQTTCVYNAQNVCHYMFDTNKNPIGQTICSGEGSGKFRAEFGAVPWEARYLCAWWRNDVNCNNASYALDLIIQRKFLWFSAVDCNRSYDQTPPSTSEIQRILSNKISTTVTNDVGNYTYKATVNASTCFRLTVCLELEFGGQ